mmetsp:Transcript_4079/g.7435  ORF Transcript_4079/g.7435 Transcript_4079/m.7435 type:complete len:235 (+) Transcript_4079:120-824(+)
MLQLRCLQHCFPCQAPDLPIALKARELSKQLPNSGLLNTAPVHIPAPHFGDEVVQCFLDFHGLILVNCPLQADRGRSRLLLPPFRCPGGELLGCSVAISRGDDEGSLSLDFQSHRLLASRSTKLVKEAGNGLSSDRIAPTLELQRHRLPAPTETFPQRRLSRSLVHEAPSSCLHATIAAVGLPQDLGQKSHHVAGIASGVKSFCSKRCFLLDDFCKELQSRAHEKVVCGVPGQH